MTCRQWSSVCTAPGAATTLDKTVAIEQRVDGALGWDFYVGKSSGQALANFASTPAGVLAFQVQDVVLHLKRQLVGVVMRTSASVRQTLHAAVLIAIEDLVTGLAGNAKFLTELRHWLPRSARRHDTQSFIHQRTN